MTIDYRLMYALVAALASACLAVGTAAAAPARPDPAHAGPAATALFDLPIKPEAVAPGGSKGDARGTPVGFDAPVSFFAYEKRGIAAFLDSKRAVLVVCGLDGKRRGELSLPFEKPAIDMAYFPATGRIFVIFQASALLGVADVNLGSRELAFKNVKTLDLASAIGGTDPMLQRIWACATGSPDGEHFFVESVTGARRRVAFRYGGGRLVPLAKIDGRPDQSAAGAHDAQVMLTVEVADDGGAALVWQEFADGACARLPLPRELGVRHAGYGCRGCTALGEDAAGNAFVEALVGSANDNVSDAFAYRFDPRGKFTGRTRIFTASGLIANRSIFVDDAGTIFYVRKDPQKGVARLYKFAID